MASLPGDPPVKSRRLFGFPRRTPRPRDRRASDRSDVTIAALGVTLGVICALFPWYIFFNQDQFGIRAMKFSGSGDRQSLSFGSDAERIGAPMSLDDFEPLQLDLFGTGATAANAPDQQLPGVDEQPFPAAKPIYRVIHIANGRAMVEDDSGLFLIQPGATLPDNSRVRSIEQRQGRWVVVTSEDKVLEIVK